MTLAPIPSAPTPQDTSGNFSPTNTVNFNFIPSATLTVQTNGLGAITPVDNGKLLAIGTNYTLTAIPGNNWIFSNWVASGSENFVSNNPVLKFTMQSNLVLQANFVTNVFLAAQGTYNGLFAPANAPRQQTNSGAITFSRHQRRCLVRQTHHRDQHAVVERTIRPGGRRHHHHAPQAAKAL